MVETCNKNKKTTQAKKTAAPLKGPATRGKKTTPGSKKPTAPNAGITTMPVTQPFASFHPNINANLIAQANSTLDLQPNHMFSGARAHGKKHVNRCVKFEKELIEVILAEKDNMPELSLLQVNIHGKNSTKSLCSLL